MIIHDVMKVRTAFMHVDSIIINSRNHLPANCSNNVKVLQIYGTRIFPICLFTQSCTLCLRSGFNKKHCLFTIDQKGLFYSLKSKDHANTFKFDMITSE